MIKIKEVEKELKINNIQVSELNENDVYLFEVDINDYNYLYRFTKNFQSLLLKYNVKGVVVPKFLNCNIYKLQSQKSKKHQEENTHE